MYNNCRLLKNKGNLVCFHFRGFLLEVGINDEILHYLIYFEVEFGLQIRMEYLFIFFVSHTYKKLQEEF